MRTVRNAELVWFEGIIEIRRGRWSMIGVKVLGKCLSRLETSELAPHFFTTLFSYAPQNRGDLALIVQNTRGAFCGIGFIHLNIAEIHEDSIGARKHVFRLAIRAQNERIGSQSRWKQ